MRDEPTSRQRQGVLSCGRGNCLGALFLLPSIVLTATWALCIYRMQLSVLNEDVVWFLTAAGRLLNGDRFGADVVEINTPPAVLLYAPAVLLTRTFGLSMALGHHLAVTAIASLTIILMVRILYPMLVVRGAQPWLWVLAQATFLAFCVQIFQFGQRDSIVGLLLLPLVALEAVRLGDAAWPRVWVQVLVGVLLTLAIAIKPHYLFVAVAFWALRAFQIGLPAFVRAADVRAAVVTGSALVILSLVLFPEWIDIARVAWRYYAYLDRPVQSLLVELIEQRWPLLALAVITVCVWWTLPKTAPFRPLMQALFLAWPGLALGYLLQSKGFAYHLVPLEIAVELSGALAVMSVLHHRGGAHWPALGMSMALLAAAGFLILPMRSDAFPHPDFFKANAVVEAVRANDKGHGMLLLDTGVSPGIYATPLYGTRIASRAQCSWLLGPMVVAVQTLSGDAADQARRDIAELEQGIIDDLRQKKPDVVVVSLASTLADGSNMLDYLLRNPDFTQIWAGYRPLTKAAWGNKPLAIYVKAAE